MKCLKHVTTGNFSFCPVLVQTICVMLRYKSTFKLSTWSFNIYSQFYSRKFVIILEFNVFTTNRITFCLIIKDLQLKGVKKG